MGAPAQGYEVLTCYPLQGICGMCRNSVGYTAFAGPHTILVILGMGYAKTPKASSLTGESCTFTPS